MIDDRRSKIEDGHQVSSRLPRYVAVDIGSMAKSDTGGFATSGVPSMMTMITFFVPNTNLGDFGSQIFRQHRHVVDGVSRV